MCFTSTKQIDTYILDCFSNEPFESSTKKRHIKRYAYTAHRQQITIIPRGMLVSANCCGMCLGAMMASDLFNAFLSHSCTDVPSRFQCRNASD